MRKPSHDSAADRPRALFLAPEAPYPLAGGGALRSASVLEFLARRYAVEAIVFRQPGAPNPGETIPPELVHRLSVIDLPRHARHTLARVARNARRLARRAPPLVDRFSGFEGEIASHLKGRYELAVVEHFWCAPYWEQIAAHCKKVVLNLHNIESAWHQRQARVAPQGSALAYSVFEQASLALERRWLPRFALLLTTSEEDARRVRLIAPATRVEVYPNAIPWIEPQRRAEEEVIAFSGTFDYDPNRSAVRHFRRHIWPLLRERWPKLRWRLVGRNPEAVKRYVQADPRIECTGAVDNAVEQLAAAKVVVVPILAGSGTRLKIVEAWAAGRAVVSTAAGAEGLPAVSGQHIMIEDDAEKFAEAVSRLLASPLLRNRLGVAGRALYEKEFTWQAAWDRLAVVLNTL